MLKRITGHACCLLVAGILLPACGGGGGGAETPDRLIESLAEGIENGDSSRVENLVDQSTPVGEVMAGALGKMAEVSQAAQKMKAAAEKKFGKDEALKAMAGSSQFSPAGNPKDLVAKAKIDIDGDKATVTNPDNPRSKMQLVRKGGRWYIDAESMAGQQAQGTSSEELKKSAKMMDQMFDSMVEVFNDTSLVEEAKDAEDFGKKLNEKMMGVIFGMMSKMKGAS